MLTFLDHTSFKMWNKSNTLQILCSNLYNSPHQRFEKDPVDLLIRYWCPTLSSDVWMSFFHSWLWKIRQSCWKFDNNSKKIKCVVGFHQHTTHNFDFSTTYTCDSPVLQTHPVTTVHIHSGICQQFYCSPIPLFRGRQQFLRQDAQYYLNQNNNHI